MGFGATNAWAADDFSCYYETGIYEPGTYHRFSGYCFNLANGKKLCDDVEKSLSSVCQISKRNWDNLEIACPRAWSGNDEKFSVFAKQCSRLSFTLTVPDSTAIVYGKSQNSIPVQGFLSGSKFTVPSSALRCDTYKCEVSIFIPYVD